jgi:hypothetical protein
MGSPVLSRSYSLGGEHHRGQFHPSPDRQNSWNRSPRSDITYAQLPDLRSPMINYNEHQSLPYQSPHHDFVSGLRPIQQQPPHLSPQRSVPPHWGPSGGALHGDVHQIQPAPYLGSNVRWSHQATGLDSGLHLPSRDLHDLLAPTSSFFLHYYTLVHR